MLLYDENFKLIGITEDSLNLLGFSNFKAFTSDFSDINELFMNKSGFISPNKDDFKNFLKDSDINRKNAILEDKNSHFIEICLKKNNFFSTENLKYIVLDLQNVKSDIDSKKNVSLNKNNTPNVFDLEYKKTIEMLNSCNSQNNATKSEICDNKNFDIDDNWFYDTLKKLEIGSDDFRFFLKEFLKGQVDLEEKLQEALLLNDKNAIKSIISTLRDPATNLNLKPVLFYLDKFEKSKANEISGLFRDYKNMLKKIENYTESRQRKLV